MCEFSVVDEVNIDYRRQENSSSKDMYAMQPVLTVHEETQV